VKRSRLPRQSAKAVERAMHRRAFVADFLRQHPVCQWPECRRDSFDVHEPKTRARGGSILDPDNAVALCRQHHDWVHDHPLEAEQRGLLRHSWEDQ